MDIKVFSELIKRQSREIEQLMRRQLPIKVGRMAKDHYQDNFRKGGFVNRVLLRQRLPTTRCFPGATTCSVLSSMCQETTV